MKARITATVIVIIVIFFSLTLQQKVVKSVTTDEQLVTAIMMASATETVHPRTGDSVATYWKLSGFSKDYSLPIFEEAIRKLNPELPVFPRDDKPLIIPKK